MAKEKARSKENTPKNRVKSNVKSKPKMSKTVNSKIKKTPVKRKTQASVPKPKSPKKKLLTVSEKKSSGSKSKLVQKEKNNPTISKKLNGDQLQQDLISNKRKAKVIKAPKEKKKQKIETIPEGAPPKTKTKLNKKESLKVKVDQKGILKKNENLKKTVGKKDENVKVKSTPKRSSAKIRIQFKTSLKPAGTRSVKDAMGKPPVKGKKVNTKSGSDSTVQPQSLKSSKLAAGGKSVKNAVMKAVVKERKMRNKTSSSNRAKKPKTCDLTLPQVADFKEAQNVDETDSLTMVLPDNSLDNGPEMPGRIQRGKALTSNQAEKPTTCDRTLSEVADFEEAQTNCIDEKNSTMNEKFSEAEWEDLEFLIFTEEANKIKSLGSDDNEAVNEVNNLLPDDCEAKDEVKKSPGPAEECSSILDEDLEALLCQTAQDSEYSGELDDAQPEVPEAEKTLEDTETASSLSMADDSSMESSTCDSCSESPEFERTVVEKSPTQTNGDPVAEKPSQDIRMATTSPQITRIRDDSSMESPIRDSCSESPELEKTVVEKSPFQTNGDSVTEKPSVNVSTVEQAVEITCEHPTSSLTPSNRMDPVAEKPSQDILMATNSPQTPSIRDDVSTISSVSDTFNINSPEMKTDVLGKSPFQSVREDLYLSSSTSRRSSVDSLSSDSVFGVHDLSQRRKSRKRVRRNLLQSKNNPLHMKNSQDSGQYLTLPTSSPSKSLTCVDDETSPSPRKKMKPNSEEFQTHISGKINSQLSPSSNSSASGQEGNRKTVLVLLEKLDYSSGEGSQHKDQTPSKSSSQIEEENRMRTKLQTNISSRPIIQPEKSVEKTVCLGKERNDNEKVLGAKRHNSDLPDQLHKTDLSSPCKDNKINASSPSKESKSPQSELIKQVYKIPSPSPKKVARDSANDVPKEKASNENLPSRRWLRGWQINMESSVIPEHKTDVIKTKGNPQFLDVITPCFVKLVKLDSCDFTRESEGTPKSAGSVGDSTPLASSQVTTPIILSTNQSQKMDPVNAGKPKLNRAALFNRNRIFRKSDPPKTVVESPLKQGSDVLLNGIGARAVNKGGLVKKLDHKVIQRPDNSIEITVSGLKGTVLNNIAKIPNKNPQNQFSSAFSKKIEVEEKDRKVNGISDQKTRCVLSSKSNDSGLKSLISDPQNRTQRKKITFLENDDLLPKKTALSPQKNSSPLVKTVLNKTITDGNTVSPNSGFKRFPTPNKPDNHVFTLPQPVHDRFTVVQQQEERFKNDWGKIYDLPNSARNEDDDSTSVLSLDVNPKLLSEVDETAENRTPVSFERKRGSFFTLKNDESSTRQRQAIVFESNAQLNANKPVQFQERFNAQRSIQPPLRRSHKRDKFSRGNDDDSDEDDEEIETNTTTSSSDDQGRCRINLLDCNQPKNVNATNYFNERLGPTTSSCVKQGQCSSSNSILSEYCITFWRTSSNEVHHQCGLKHEIPTFSNKDKKEVTEAIETTIEDSFNNPPIRLLKTFVEFCVQEEKTNTLIHIGKSLKKNLGLDKHSLQRTKSLWDVFFEQCLALSPAQSSMSRDPYDKSSTLNGYLKDIFYDFRKNNQVLSIALESLAKASSNYKHLKLLNCVEFLNQSRFPWNLYPTSFKLAVTKQVLYSRSRRFAYKVFKVFYNEFDSYKEIYLSDPKTVKTFTKIVMEHNFDVAIPNWFKGLVQEKTQRSHSADIFSGNNNFSRLTQPGTSRDTFFSAAERPPSDLDLRDLLRQPHFNPTTVIRCLEKNNLSSKDIFDTFFQLEKDLAYDKILEHASDSIKEALIDVTTSFMYLAYQKKDFRRCYFYLQTMKNIDPSKIKVFVDGPMSPAAIVFMLIKIYLMNNDFLHAVGNCSYYNLFCSDYHQWKIYGTQQDLDLQESMFCDFKCALSQNIPLEQSYRAFTEVIRMQKSIIHPIENPDMFLIHEYGLQESLKVVNILKNEILVGYEGASKRLDVSNFLTGLIDRLMDDPHLRPKALLLITEVGSLDSVKELKIENCNHYRFFIVELVKHYHKDGRLEILNVLYRLLIKASLRVLCYPRDFRTKSGFLELRTSLASEEMWLIVHSKLKVFDYKECLKVNFVDSNDTPPYTEVDCSTVRAKARFREVLHLIVPEASILKDEPNTITVDRITLQAHKERLESGSCLRPSLPFQQPSPTMN